MSSSSGQIRRNRGLLIVLSGPSAAGKNTLLNALMERLSDIKYSVSATTRAPRPGEQDGVNYYFLTREEFERRAAQGEFLEWAEFCGNLYGTPRKYVEEVLASGQDIIMDIDIQGAKQVRKAMPEAVSVFLMPPSAEELRKRIVKRGKDSEEAIRQRLSQVDREIQAVFDYDYVILNDDLERAVGRLVSIILAERSRVPRCDVAGFIREFQQSALKSGEGGRGSDTTIA